MERAILVGIDLEDGTDFDRSMKELKALAEACDMEVCGMVTQKLPYINKAYYIGTGKVNEVKEYASALEASVVVFDNPLSPAQLGNLKEATGKAVLDRTNLILQIFSTRARTREAKLQVESANLQYLLPRLVGAHDALSRQGGASGAMSNKGAGEKKLELDRRHIEKRLAQLRRELKEVEAERETQRKSRRRSNLSVVALVGYTNAGKSSLMNGMLNFADETEKKQVFEKDMLFATLDTTVRKIEVPKRKSFLLTDTVGFIDKLPHQLVKAFYSTLEEVRNADLLIHVVDLSDPDYREHMRVTIETLHDLEADGIPRITVFNKTDLAGRASNIQEMLTKPVSTNEERKVRLSAKNPADIEALVSYISRCAYREEKEAGLLLPYEKGSIYSYLKGNATILSEEYRADGIFVKAILSEQDAGKYREFIEEK
ncbi:MAG: GTPase HflX [Lachnospiraceae bacterium]|nr:GTPase HflX [Lachnospiraceae bacterium]